MNMSARQYRITHEQLTLIANAVARLPWSEADRAMQAVKMVARQPIQAAPTPNGTPEAPWPEPAFTKE
jgi:hypothetical protein